MLQELDKNLHPFCERLSTLNRESSLLPPPRDPASWEGLVNHCLQPCRDVTVIC